MFKSGDLREGVGGSVRCLGDAMKEKNNRSTASGVVMQSNRVIIHSLSTVSNSLGSMIKNLEAHLSELPATSIAQNSFQGPSVSPHPKCPEFKSSPALTKGLLTNGLVNSVKYVPASLKGEVF